MFSIRIKQLREDAGMSQADLAKRIDVAQSTVGMWENGKNTPKPRTLAKLANIFQVSIDYLIGNTDHREPSGLVNVDSGAVRGSSLFDDDREHTLDDILKMIEDHLESRQDSVPRTKEARMVSAGIDRMPPDDRKRAQDLMELMFSKYFKEE